MKPRIRIGNDGEAHLKIEQLSRELHDAQIVIRKEANTTRLSFSGTSEYPVERWFGTEVLSHAKGAVRLDRANGGALPLLFNHNPDDVVGMVDAVAIKDSRTSVDAHLFNTARGNEVAVMIADGLRNISAGYRMHTLEEDKKGDVFIATDWEPLEFSIAPVPADPTVGMGRANHENEAYEVRMIRASSLPAQPAVTSKGTVMEATTNGNQAGGTAAPDVQLGIDYAAQELLRIKGLQALGRSHDIPDDVVEKWLDEGTTGDQAAHACLKIVAERKKAAIKNSPAAIGLTDREIQRYSMTRAIKACVEKSWATVAPLEAEASQAVAKRMGKQGGEHTFFVPLEVQWARSQQRLQRDLIVGTSTMGGYLVGTDVQSFIELLRNRSVVMRLGATTMPGLVGSVAIPKQTAASTAYWFSDETGTATESQPTFGQITLVPKTVAGYVELSRQLLLQSTPNAEGIVNADLAAVIALAVDTAAISGPGTGGQPTGITKVTGLGTSNPSTGSASTYADMIRFQTTVASSNAMLPGFSYVTTPTVAGILMGKPRFTNSDTPIWDGTVMNGTVVGAPAMSSLQIGSGQMLAGDFSQVVIGEWGVLEIETNPYAQFQAAIVGVRAIYTVDVAVRYAAAFALGTGITG